MSTIYNHLLATEKLINKSVANKNLASTPQSASPPYRFGVSVITPKLPFRYSKIAYGLSACMLAYFAFPEIAHAAEIGDNLPNNVSKNQSANVSERLSQTDIEKFDQDFSSSLEGNRATDSTEQLSDDQLEEALIALRLKRAVEQGIIDPSVLEDYQRETLGGKPLTDNAKSGKALNIKEASSDKIEVISKKDDRFTSYSKSADRLTDNITETNNNLENVSDVQIEKGIDLGIDSDVVKINNVNIDDLKNNNNVNTNIEANQNLDHTKNLDDTKNLDHTKNSIDRFFSDESNDTKEAAVIDANSNQDWQSPEQLDQVLDKISAQLNTEFDKPAATLNASEPPLGFDTKLDDSTILKPNNRETLGLMDEEEAISAKTQNADTDKVEIDPSEYKSKDVSLTNDTEAESDINSKTVANIGEVDDSIKQTDGDITKDLVTEAQANSKADSGINPEDYLPEYESDANGGYEVGSAADNEADTTVESKPGFFKRIYNQLFNDGYAALPRIKANIYIQAEDSDAVSNPRLVKADKDTQPAKNIKAAMENITVEAITDFTAVIPKLREEALDAAQAVGYYDVRLNFQREANNEINVIIEHLGEPVIVSSRIVDIRGEGADLDTFQEIAETAPPKAEDIFNHGVYKTAKSKIESAKEQYGFFDGQWLNKSVDVILPDNTADVDLIYDTGQRYHFDKVVFFTIDKETGQLTTDPDKLPVKPELLHQLHEFKAGDDFDGTLITKFTNDLSATRYFNAVNVETVRPGDSNGTLGFDGNDNGGDESQGVDGDMDAVSSEMDSENTNGELAAIETTEVDSNGSKSESVNANNQAEDDLSDDLKPIEYTVDQETTDKLAEITAKAERLSRLPDDRVLDEENEEAKSLLGKISNTISNTVKKILPDDKDPLADTDSLPDDLSETVLAKRKTPSQVQETKSVPLYVFVTADKPKDVDLGIGYGTDTGVRAVARFEHNLINREGYQAGVSVGASGIDKSINIHASRPWKHPLDDILTGNVSYEQEVINQGEGNLDLKTNTIQAGIARKIRRDTGWNRTYSLRYRLDQLESGVKGPDRMKLPIPFNREGASFEQEALLLGYKLDKTTTDNVINPVKGWHQYYSIEAGTESALTDTDMAIIRAGVNGVYSFGDMNKHQLVGSLDGGYIWADDFDGVPYKLRFFAGGDRSIRGYDYNSLSALENGYLTGGQVLAVGSTEYNYEFKPGLRGAVFADFGNAYDKDFNTETKLGVGFGVRWASPVGMVRVDLAAGVLEDSIPVRLHFFIGSPLQ